MAFTLINNWILNRWGAGIFLDIILNLNIEKIIGRNGLKNQLKKHWKNPKNNSKKNH